MHRNDVMSLAHYLSGGEIDMSYALKLAWRIYRILKDETVSSAFWMGFVNGGTYMDLLIWDAARQIATGHIDVFEEYFDRIDDGIWDEFDIVMSDMLEYSGTDSHWNDIWMLSSYGEAYLLAMKERIYNAAVPVNLFTAA